MRDCPDQVDLVACVCVCVMYVNLMQEDQPKCEQHHSLALGPELCKSRESSLSSKCTWIHPLCS